MSVPPTFERTRQMPSRPGFTRQRCAHEKHLTSPDASVSTSSAAAGARRVFSTWARLNDTEDPPNTGNAPNIGAILTGRLRARRRRNAPRRLMLSQPAGRRASEHLLGALFAWTDRMLRASVRNDKIRGARGGSTGAMSQDEQAVERSLSALGGSSAELLAPACGE